MEQQVLPALAVINKGSNDGRHNTSSNEEKQFHMPE